MVKIIQEHPFVDPDGFERYSLISFWAEDENHEKYLMRQAETGAIFAQAVNTYPSQFTYEPTKIKVDDLGRDTPIEQVLSKENKQGE